MRIPEAQKHMDPKDPDTDPDPDADPDPQHWFAVENCWTWWNGLERAGPPSPAELSWRDLAAAHPTPAGNQAGPSLIKPNISNL